MTLLVLVSSAAPAWAQIPFARAPLVRTEGKEFVAPDGQVLHIKGINLRNWLMPEGYMFKFEQAKAPRQIYGAFERLLGSERAAEFWHSFRERYVTQDDIRFIKSVGFNTVRIPLQYELFMTDDGVMAGDGWTLIDRVLGWARDAGLYVILDLHAAPGGQTGINHENLDVGKRELGHGCVPISMKRKL